MLNVKCFVCNMLQENCYVVSDETAEAVIIDCGAYYDSERRAVVAYIEDQHLRPRHLLCTHGHFDHCFGNDTIWRQYGLKPEVAAEDEWLMDIKQQVSAMLGTDYSSDVPPVGRLLAGGDVITFGTHTLNALPTPGHTPGGLSFYCAEERVLFTGDTLFHQSVGRTDFERSSWQQLQDSLCNVIARLPADTTVYPGHGPGTTIGVELRMNPYLRASHLEE